MILTEEEAKTKWCHLLLNAEGDIDPQCTASGCMAWRDAGYPHGYCGLAGKPLFNSKGESL